MQPRILNIDVSPARQISIHYEGKAFFVDIVFKLTSKHHKEEFISHYISLTENDLNAIYRQSYNYDDKEILAIQNNKDGVEIMYSDHLVESGEPTSIFLTFQDVATIRKEFKLFKLDTLLLEGAN